jgi:hypothetical protein
MMAIEWIVGVALVAVLGWWIYDMVMWGRELARSRKRAEAAYRELNKALDRYQAHRQAREIKRECEWMRLDD